MPIRAENRDRYPADWPEISKRIRARAGNHCEQCKAPNGETVLRCRGSEDYHFQPTYAVACGIGAHVFQAETGELLGVRVLADLEREGWRPVRIILTVAHLDHTPENCADDNLRALCQRCHNAYDAPMRRAGIKSRSRARRAVGDLLDQMPGGV